MIGEASHLLSEAALRQLLEFGLFHGDPHAGNVFAMNDGRTRIKLKLDVEVAGLVFVRFLFWASLFSSVVYKVIHLCLCEERFLDRFQKLVINLTVQAIEIHFRMAYVDFGNVANISESQRDVGSQEMVGGTIVQLR